MLLCTVVERCAIPTWDMHVPLLLLTCPQKWLPFGLLSCFGGTQYLSVVSQPVIPILCVCKEPSPGLGNNNGPCLGSGGDCSIVLSLLRVSLDGCMALQPALGQLQVWRGLSTSAASSMQRLWEATASSGGTNRCAFCSC